MIAIHEKLAVCHPSLARGQVWCRSCGHTRKVNTPGALAHGWPKCCGHTMTIDSPEEQLALAAARERTRHSSPRQVYQPIRDETKVSPTPKDDATLEGGETRP